MEREGPPLRTDIQWGARVCGEGFVRGSFETSYKSHLRASSSMEALQGMHEAWCRRIWPEY